MKISWLWTKINHQTFAFWLVLSLTLLLPHVANAQDDNGDQGNGNGDDNGVSFQTFYDQLNDDGGQWIQTDDYGYAWQPPVNDPDWRPYSEGHWAYTDDGWTWVSDEPWGWATYHYGRWVNLDGEGWVWVPGYRWAPAWVSWRYGGGYAGWAPLPPESCLGIDYARPGFSLGINFHIGGDADIAFHIGAGCYNFVPVEHLCEPRLHGYYVPRYNNYGVINHTTNVTNVYVNNNYYNNGGTHNRFGSVTNGGPSLTAVNAVSRTPVQRMNLAATNQPGLTRQDGNTLHIYAPRVNAATFHSARPAEVARTISTPRVNRGDSIDRPLQPTASVRPPPPSSEQIQAAHHALADAPSSAKIATVNTAPKIKLAQPFTQLKTAADFQKPAGNPVHNSGQNPSNTSLGQVHSKTSTPTPDNGGPVHSFNPSENGSQHSSAPFTEHINSENNGPAHNSNAAENTVQHSPVNNTQASTHSPSPSTESHTSEQNSSEQFHHDSTPSHPSPPASSYHSAENNSTATSSHPSSSTGGNNYHPTNTTAPHSTNGGGSNNNHGGGSGNSSHQNNNTGQNQNQNKQNQQPSGH